MFLCHRNILQSSLDIVLEIQGAKIVLTGDLNADFNTMEGTKLRTLASNYELTIHINEATRITETSKTTLDQVVTNIPQMVKSTSVMAPVATSDHCLVAASLLFRKRTHLAYKRTMWQFSKTNFENYRMAIANFDWDSCFSNDIDETANSWTRCLLSLANDHILHKVVTVRPDDKPWYNGNLRYLLRKKNHLFSAFKKTQTEDSWNRFKRVRNEYMQLVNDAKLSYEKGKFFYIKSHHHLKSGGQLSVHSRKLTMHLNQFHPFMSMMISSLMTRERRRPLMTFS